MYSKISFPAILFLFLVLSQKIIRSESYENSTPITVKNLIFNTSSRVASKEEAYCEGSFVSNSILISLNEIGFEPDHLKVPALYLVQSAPSYNVLHGEPVGSPFSLTNSAFVPYVLISLKSPHREIPLQSFLVTETMIVFTIGACSLIEAANHLLDCNNIDYSDLKLHFKTIAPSKNVIISYTLKAVITNENTINLFNSMQGNRKCIANKESIRSKMMSSECFEPAVKYISLEKGNRLSCSIQKPNNKIHQSIWSLEDQSKKSNLFSIYHAIPIFDALKNRSHFSLVGEQIQEDNRFMIFHDKKNTTKLFFSLNSNVVNSGVVKFCIKFNSTQYTPATNSVFVRIKINSHDIRLARQGSAHHKMEVDQIDTPEHFTSTLCATFTVCDLSNFVKEYPIEDVTYSFVIETNFDFSPKNTLVKAYTKFTKTTLDLNKIQSYDLFIPETMCTFSECYPLTNSFLISIKTPKTIVRDENGIQCDLPANPVVIDPEGFRLQKLFDKHIMNSVDDLCRSPQKAAENSRDTGIQSKMEHLNSPIEKNSIVRSKYTVAPNLEPWYCDLHELGENGTLCLNKLKRHMIDIIKCFLDHNELLTNISTVNGQMFFSKNYLQCLDEAQKEAVENLNSNSKNNSEFLTKFVDQIVKKRSYNDQTFTNGHSTRVGDNVGTLSNLSQRVFVKKETTENCFCTIDDITVQVNNQPVNLSTILKNLESCKDKLTTVNTGNTLSNVNLNDNDQKQDINTPSPQKRKNNNGGKGKHTQIKEELKKCQSDLQLNNNTLYVCNTNYTNAAANHERCEAALNDTKNEFSKSEETLNSTSKSLSECESKRKDVSDSAKKCQNNLTLALNDTKTCNTRIEDLFNKFKECNVSLNHSHENVTSLLAEMKVIKDNYTNVDKERVQLKLDMKEVIEKLNNILLIHGLLPDDNATVFSKLEILKESSRKSENLLKEKTKELQQSNINVNNISAALTKAEKNIQKNSEECKARIKQISELEATTKNITELKTELQSTEQAARNLSSQIVEKQKNISQLEEIFKNVQKANENISNVLVTSEENRTKLKTELESTEQAVRNLSSQIVEKQKNISQLEEIFKNVQKANENISNVLVASEENRTKLKTELESTEQAARNLSSQIVEKQKNISQLEEIFKNVQEANKNISNVLVVSEENRTKLKTELESTEQAARNLSSQIEEKRKNISRLEEIFKNVQEADENISNVLVASEENRTKLKTELESTEQAARNLSSQIVEKQKNISQLEEIFKNVQEANDNISNVLVASEENRTKLKTELESIEQAAGNLSSQIEAKRKNISQLEEIFKNVQEANKNISNVLVVSEENRTKLKTELESTEQAARNLSSQIEEKRKNISRLEEIFKNVQEADENISNVLVASEENRTKLKTELESTEETTGNLSSQITKKKKNISELEEELKKVKETNGKISKDLETSTKDIEKLLAKVKTVEEKKTNIETQTEACKNTVTQLTEDLQTLRDAKMNITSKLDELEKKSSRLEANLQNLTEAKQTILNDLERSQKYLVKFVCQNYVGWKSQEEYNACLLQSPIHYSKALDQGVAYKDDGLVANGKYYPKSVFYLDVCSALTSTNSNPLTKATNNDHLCVDKLRQCYEARNTCVMKMFEQQVRLQSYLDSNDTKIADELTCDPMYNMHIELLSFFNKHMNYISSCLMNQDNDSHEFNLSSIKYVRSANDPVRHSESSEKENQKSSPALLSKRANVQKPVNGHVISTDEKQILEDLSVLNNLLGKLLRENTLTNPNKQNAQVSTNILLNNNIQSGSSHGNNVNINALVNLKYDANKPLQKIPSSWCTEEGKKNPRVAKAIELFGLLPENYQFLKQNAAVLSRMFDSDDLEKAVKVLSEPQIFLTTITKNIKPDEFTNLTESSINEKKKLNDPQGNNTELIFDQFSDNKKKIGHSKDAGIKQPNLQNTQTTEESSSDLEKSENIMPEKKQYPDANNIQPTIDQTSQKKLANINKPISILQQPSNATNPPVRVGNIVNQTLDEKKYTTGSEGENTTSRTTNVKQLALVATGGLFVVGAVSALSWYLWIKKDRTTQDALGLQASESMYDWDDQLDDISALQ